MKPLKTVVVGFGKIAQEYSFDPLYAKYWEYPTHASVLKEHSGYQWNAVVDPSKKALDTAQKKWGIPIVAKSIQDLPNDYKPDVVVMATPPHVRKEIITALPDLKAVMLEKPIGVNSNDGLDFIRFCKDRKLIVQVNLYRRGDNVYHRLMGHQLSDLVGRPQSGFCVYGNGIRNNGVHLIDLIRMLFGEIRSVQALQGFKPEQAGPIKDDYNIPAVLTLENGAPIAIFPISFSHYREVSLEVWGEKGMLTCLLEGLENTIYPVNKNRCLVGEKEVSTDKPIQLGTGVSDAIFNLYDNLYCSTMYQEELISPLESALRSELVVTKILESSEQGSALIQTGKDFFK